MKALCIRALAVGLSLLAFSTAQAGADLDAVKQRGFLRCGVSEDIPGFSVRDAAGNWRGMNADFCRAVAAAVVGDPAKVEFVGLKASKRFPALQSKTVDLLVANATHTMTREALIKLQFPAVLFFDGQGFMVRKSAKIKSVAHLDKASICVEKGTTSEARLPDFFGLKGMAVTPLVFDSDREAREAFEAGRCQAYTSDSAKLTAQRTRMAGKAGEFDILPERISREPMGPVVRNGDQEWETLVRWIVHILVIAEEVGVTADNADKTIMSVRTRISDLVSGRNEWVARNLGVRGDWAHRALKAAGNYGEIYERHFGPHSAVPIERGYNRLWLHGGLIYAPPLD